MSLLWQQVQGGNIPGNAVLGGQDRTSRENVYISRANQGGDVIPGKALRGQHNCAYVPFGGKEVAVTNYEVLVSNNPRHTPTWQPASSGQKADHAVQGGYTQQGEPLYIARGRAPDGGQCPGKFHPSHKVCYIPWGGEERACHQYEVLCLN